MKELYSKYINEIKSKKVIFISVILLLVLGLLFGSLYITIISNEDKKYINDSVYNYFNSFNTISFSDKLKIFKESLISNITYFCLIWALGISIIGLPVVYIMTFFKSFIVGFSIASIFAKYKFSGLLGILVYLFPNKLIILILGLFLAIYSVNISLSLVNNAFKKKTVNFASFMGKYVFLLLVCILICIICSIFEAFISPYLYKLIINLLK
ncbi:MAG: stage II sporulation protein M [Bacilli bacterium]|nr:stage II sporulation protein M [Bacilli bacterium]